MSSNIVTIRDAYRDVVKKFPDKTALIFKDEEFTFTELDSLVGKVAAYFHNKGLRRNDRVILYLPHMQEWISIWLGMQSLGVTVLPITHFYGHDEVSYIAGDSGVKIIFCSERNFDNVARAAEDHPFDTIIIVGDNYNAESARKIKEKGTELISYTDVMTETSPPPEIKVEPTDLAEILYTGGTTGPPKGVPLSNILLLEAMNVKRDEFATVLPRGTGVALQGAPLFHILGKEVGFSSLLAGDALILLAKMDIDTILSAVEKYRVTTFFGTPTLCRMILEHENVDKYDCSSFVYVFTAGEAMPKEVNKQWTERFKNPTYSGYGSTETCGGITGIPVGEDYPAGTSGKVVPTKQVVLVNPDTMEPVAPGEPGEILVTSEHMVKGYLNKPVETAAHFVEMDGKTWYKTGDIVRFDENGWIFFVDRSVDMIKHKGYRVAATKIEAVIYKHEAVHECCVVGVPDEKEGEKIKAFIVTKAGYDGVKAEDITKWCEETLSSYEIPNYVEFRKELPKSVVGKILRRKLRDEEREKIARQN